VTSAIPPDIVCADDYARRAQSLLSPAAAAYIDGGNGDDQALRSNRDAFAAVALLPRVLRRGGEGSTRLRLFGQALRHPIVLAPVARHGLVHADAEAATARAARATDTLMVASTQSTLPLETIAAELGGVGAFQLYLQPRREDTLALVRRAEAAGFNVLFVTLDAPVQMASRAAMRAGPAWRAADTVPNLARQLPPSRREVAADASLVFQGAMADAPDWDDLAWLRRETRLPILAKGVAHPDDAARLVELGIDGLAVSNHGGRALSVAPASLHLLPAIRARVGASVPLLLDGGIRSGSDVFKALAFGADAAMIGRPQLHALAVAGAAGVAHLLRLLRDELEVTMALTACFTLAEIDRRAVFERTIPC
jgi:4-hydroxymandelate oxidase